MVTIISTLTYIKDSDIRFLELLLNNENIKCGIRNPYESIKQDTKLIVVISDGLLDYHTKNGFNKKGFIYTCPYKDYKIDPYCLQWIYENLDYIDSSTKVLFIGNSSAIAANKMGMEVKLIDETPVIKKSGKDLIDILSEYNDSIATVDYVIKDDKLVELKSELFFKYDNYYLFLGNPKGKYAAKVVASLVFNILNDNNNGGRDDDIPDISPTPDPVWEAKSIKD